MQESPAGQALKPWWKHRTTWAAVLTFIAAAPALVDQVAPFLTDEQRVKAVALAAMLAAVGNIFARMGGVQAAKQLTGNTDA